MKYSLNFEISWYNHFKISCVNIAGKWLLIHTWGISIAIIQNRDC